MVYVLAVSGDGDATARMVLLLLFRAAAVAAALRRMVAAAERGRRADMVPPAAAAPRRSGPRLWLVVVCVLAIRGVIAARVPPTANVADAERCKDAMVGCACVATSENRSFVVIDVVSRCKHQNLHNIQTQRFNTNNTTTNKAIPLPVEFNCRELPCQT